MLRRSISCMCAGLLMTTAWQFFVVGAEAGWVPPGIVTVSMLTLGIAGGLWLWDEVNAR
jgi:hypothetical protein